MCRLRWRCSRYEHASYQFRRHKPQAVYISCSSCKFCSKRQRIAEATAALVRGPPLLTKNDPVMRCAFDANSILASKSAALVWMSKSKRKKTPAALPLLFFFGNGKENAAASFDAVGSFDSVTRPEHVWPLLSAHQHNACSGFLYVRT